MSVGRSAGAADEKNSVHRRPQQQPCRQGNRLMNRPETNAEADSLASIACPICSATYARAARTAFALRPCGRCRCRSSYRRCCRVARRSRQGSHPPGLLIGRSTSSAVVACHSPVANAGLLAKSAVFEWSQQQSDGIRSVLFPPHGILTRL